MLRNTKNFQDKNSSNTLFFGYFFDIHHALKFKTTKLKINDNNDKTCML